MQKERYIVTLLILEDDRGAIRMEHPLSQRATWERKETGELFRIGMKNPPPPNTKPPVC